MTEITTYVATDGKTFDDYDECKEYENSLEDAKLSKGWYDKKLGRWTLKSDIIEFFRNMKCTDCLFKTECDNMYTFTRAKSTSTLTLCDVIKDGRNIDPFE